MPVNAEEAPDTEVPSESLEEEHETIAETEGTDVPAENVETVQEPAEEPAEETVTEEPVAEISADSGDGEAFGEEPAKEEWPEESAELQDEPMTVETQTVSVVFYPNHDSAEGVMDPQEYTTGEEGILPSNQYVCPEYVFTEWNTEPDGSGTSYGDGAFVSTESDLILYAQWEKENSPEEIPGDQAPADNTVIESFEEAPILLNDGSLPIAYHTQEEIIAFMKSHPVKYLSADYNVQPSEKNVTAGELKAAVQNDALNALNQIRYIAGLYADVSIDSNQAALAQAAAFVNNTNNSMSHKPDRPAGWGSEFDEIYSRGTTGAKSSNLGMGYSSLAEAVLYGWMSDADSRNIDRVGHRRWAINPRMTTTGFGQVGAHTAMYAFDSRGSRGSVSLWPAPNTPMEYFGDNEPWSFSTGRPESLSNVKVKLTRTGTDEVWNFSSESSDGYFNVENGLYGMTGCVIFRPNSVSYHFGDTFDVEISGLSGGTVRYQVNFFKTPWTYVPATGISLNKSTAEIRQNQTITLKATVKPDDATDKSAVWESVLPLVATVDKSGNVKGVLPGRTTIYARTKDGAYAAECSVTVTAIVTRVTLNTTGLPMREGQTYTLVATVWPSNAKNKAVKWSSSNSKVVSVDKNGKMTARSGGTATITVKTVDGNKTATCTVTVTGKAPVPPAPSPTNDPAACTTFGFCRYLGKDYWYENGVRQAMPGDPKNLIDEKYHTERGREIFDPKTKAWYWLDSVYNGAKAAGKEVWMPYIYQDEANWKNNAEMMNNVVNRSNTYTEKNGPVSDMGEQVRKAIQNGDGKWVRYDENGKMMKGWVTITGKLAEVYPKQKGFTYFYDYQTGLMAKGWTTIGGVRHYFDETTGVLQR